MVGLKPRYDHAGPDANQPEHGLNKIGTKEVGLIDQDQFGSSAGSGRLPRELGQLAGNVNHDARQRLTRVCHDGRISVPSIPAWLEHTNIEPLYASGDSAAQKFGGFAREHGAADHGQ